MKDDEIMELAKNAHNFTERFYRWLCNHSILKDLNLRYASDIGSYIASRYGKAKFDEVGSCPDIFFKSKYPNVSIEIGYNLFPCSAPYFLRLWYVTGTGGEMAKHHSESRLYTNYLDESFFDGYLNEVYDFFGFRHKAEQLSIFDFI